MNWKKYILLLIWSLIINCNGQENSIEPKTAMLLLPLVGSSSNSQSDLIYNPSFEMDTDAWSISKGSYLINIDSTVGHNSAKSLKIQGATTTSGYAVPFINTPAFKTLDSNSTYKFSFWIKCNAKTFSLHTFFLDGKPSVSSMLNNCISTTWELQTLVFSPGSTVNPIIRFQPSLATTNMNNFTQPLTEENVLWIDDVSVSKL